MRNVFINIGSNLGNRRLNMSKAMSAVIREFGDIEMSHAVETEPWGFESPNRFLNVGIAFRSELEPEEILDRLQEIERSISADSHRKTDGGYADRIIDIDIVAIDEIELSTPRLTLPHPHLAERRFFLEPMAEIAGMWRHPATGKTPREMLEELHEREGEI
jgi:2-amino-4-hydroxy-6-hydroxymethyldihydropteridine diphosphokinase